MIAEFSKIQNIIPVLNYHFGKIQNGKGELLVDNTFAPEQSPSAYRKAFQQILDLNKRVTKQKYFHASINMPPTQQKVPKELFVKIANEYLIEMGYEHCPHLIFTHRDKKHDHIHIISTTVDFDGNKVNDSNDYRRSMNISRNLEKKYRLFYTNYRDDKYSGKTSVNEINASKYAISNTLKKIIQKGPKDNPVYSFLSPADINFIKTNPDNARIHEAFDAHKLFSLLEMIEKTELSKFLEKEKLIARLNYLFTRSKNYYEFKQRVISQGIYMREIQGKGGQPYIVYGDKLKGVYIPEKKLPLQLRFQSLKKYFEAGLKFLNFEQQKHVLAQIIAKGLYETIDYSSFKELMLQYGVTVHEFVNSGGIYGVSFSYNKCSFPLRLKASAIDKRFSYKSITQHFKKKQNSGIYKQRTTTSINSGYSPDGRLDLFSVATNLGISGGVPVKKGNRSKDVDQDEIDYKKRKNKGMNL